MKKNILSLGIIILVIGVALGGFFVLTQKIPAQSEDEASHAAPSASSLVELSQKELELKQQVESAYVDEFSGIISEMKRLTEEPNITKEMIETFKSRIIAFKVPTKYQDIHLQVIIAISNIEQGIDTEDQDRIEKGKTILQKQIEEFQKLTPDTR